MTTLCSEVAARTALGEPLAAAETDHLAGCAACARLVRLPGLLKPRAIEPPPGFAARTVAGAHGRRVARRRRRIGVAACAGLLLLVGFAALLMPRLKGERTAARSAASPRPPVQIDVGLATPPDDTKLVGELAALSQLDRAPAERADWGRIAEPLTPLLPLTREDTP